MKLRLTKLTMRSAYLILAVIMAVAGVGVYTFFANNGDDHGNGGLSSSSHLFQMSDVANYGFYYPITFAFSIPQQSSLKAWYRYDEVSSWYQLVEKRSTDFFNGEEAVRFDYAHNKAYVSVGFKGETNLYIKITDSETGDVATSFLEVTKYYDNRLCAVTSHHDDYGIAGGHPTLIEEFQKRGLWYGCAVVTGNANWDYLQTQVNEGYVEVQSHSVSHVTIPDQTDAGAWSQIADSRDDILSHISNMPYGDYVFVFVFPNTKMGDRDRNFLGKANYLVSEADKNTPAYHLNQYSSWYTTTYNGEAYGIFPACQTTSMGEELVDKGDDDGDGIINGMDEDYLNSQFDLAYSNNGIYELRTHPVWVVASAGYVQAHLNYIAGRSDCWYAPLGHIYAYHYVSLFVEHSVIV